MLVYSVVYGWVERRNNENTTAALEKSAILKTDLSSVINSSDEAMGIIVSLPDGAFIEETYSPKLIDMTNVNVISQRFEYFLSEFIEQSKVDEYKPWLEKLFTHRNFEFVRKIAKMNRVTTMIDHPRITGMKTVLQFDFRKMEGWSKSNKRYFFTARDITAQVQREHEQEEKVRATANEVEKIHQILKAGDRILFKFVNDTSAAISEINSKQSTEGKNPSEILEYMYDRLHSIKGHAYALELSGLAEAVHGVEADVKNLRGMLPQLDESAVHSKILDIRFKAMTF
jgi:hypothetical protein